MLADEEKENIVEMVIDSLEDLYFEKISFPDPKWKKLVNKLDVTLKIIVYGPDWEEIAGEIYYQVKKGKFKISKEPLSGVKITLKAPMENIFLYSSREMGTIRALLGKIKMKGIRHIGTILKLIKLLRIIPQKKYDKYGITMHDQLTQED